MLAFGRTSLFLPSLALLLGLAAQSANAQPVVVIDAPDVQKLRSVDESFLTSDIVGMEVYATSGRHIGEVEDFVVARGGFLYAVITLEDDLVEDGMLR
jgi:ribosomal 30S subunit maturation factor RimM